MSSTCFEPEGSSSGRLLFVQVWYKVKAKYTLDQATKTQKGSRDIALFFL